MEEINEEQDSLKDGGEYIIIGTKIMWKMNKNIRWNLELITWRTWELERMCITTERKNRE